MNKFLINAKQGLFGNTKEAENLYLLGFYSLGEVNFNHTRNNKLAFN